MINNCVMIGRLTDKIEVHTTDNGLSVATFTLAVDRDYKNPQGKRDADFIRCVIWRKGAEVLAKYTQKGSLIAVSGRMQTRSYVNKDDQSVFVTELVIERFSLLPSRTSDKRSNSDQSQETNNSQTQPANDSQQTQPKQSQQAAQAQPKAPAKDASPAQEKTAQPAAQSQPSQPQQQSTQSDPSLPTGDPFADATDFDFDDDENLPF